jgi:glyoxylase-like metal-dependent hydrolase (beta-lactamase superfamily II)
MASLRFDIISIGTLSRNRLWNEDRSVRTPHSTTSLIRAANGRNILIDPGLPAVALRARLFERTGMRPEQIDTVYLTNFRPSHRSGLDLFPKATVLIHELEQQSVARHLEQFLQQAPGEDLDRRLLEQELKLLQALRPADDSLAPQVDLFPLFGSTPGNCGLLLALPTITLLVAGDAVASYDHFLAGQVLPDSYDIQAAQESLREVYEIADLIVPGHDNLFLNPRTHGL